MAAISLSDFLIALGLESAKSILEKEDITTFDSLVESQDDIDDIDGIEKFSSTKIKEAISLAQLLADAGVVECFPQMVTDVPSASKLSLTSDAEFKALCKGAGVSIGKMNKIKGVLRKPVSAKAGSPGNSCSAEAPAAVPAPDAATSAATVVSPVVMAKAAAIATRDTKSKADEIDCSKYPHLHGRLKDGRFEYKGCRLDGVEARQYDGLARAKVIKETHDAVVEVLSPWQAHHDKIILLVGLTGAGKSTCSNFLVGCVPQLIEVINEHGDKEHVITFADLRFTTGGGTTSMTFLPGVVPVEGERTLVVDFAGFNDNTCVEVRLGMDLAFRSIIKQAKSVHPLALMDVNSVSAGRAHVARQQLNKLLRLMPPEDGYHWILGITKVDLRFTPTPGKFFSDLCDLVAETSPGLPSSMIKLNEFMNFDIGPDEMRDKAKHLRGRLTEEAYVPSRPVTNSDCLDNDDAEKFEQVLTNPAFISLFEAVMRPRIDPTGHSVDVNKDVKELAVVCEGSKKKEINLEQFKAVLRVVGQMASDLENFAAEGKHQKEKMREYGQTWTQTLFPVFNELDKLGQPRIKGFLIAADNKIMKFQLLHLINTTLQLREMCAEIKNSAYASDFTETSKKFDEVLAKLKQDCQSLGYRDADDAMSEMASTAIGVVGAGVTGTCAVGALVMGFGLPGLGWAVLGIVAVAAAVVHKNEANKWKEASSNLKAAFNRALEAIAQASSTVTEHLTVLSAEASKVNHAKKANVGSSEP